MIDDFDTREKDRNISYSDKLSYKNVIQMQIDQCLRHWNSLEIDKYVEALQHSIYFDLPGLSLKTQIDNFIEELNIEKDKKIEEYYNSGPRSITYQRVNRVKLKMKTHMWYYRALYDFLVTLLGKHKALLNVRGSVEEGSTDIIE